MVKASWPLLVLIGLSVALRAAVWAGLPDLQESRAGLAMELYKEALRHHLWKFLLYEHTEPSGLSLVHAVLLRLFGDAGFSNGVMLVPAMVNGVLSVCLIYMIAHRLGAHPFITWPLCTIYSIGLIPFEVWWYGWTLDHYTIVLVAFFAWALVARTGHARLRYDVLAAVAGGLLVTIQKVACVVVPLMLVGTAWLLRRADGSRVRRTMIALVGPVCVAGVLIGKNALANRVYATSSLAGPNVAVFLYAAKGYSYDNVAAFAKRAGAPAWYQWCFKRAQVLQPAWGPAYGACYLSDDASAGPYDFGPVQQYLASHGEERLARLVAEDQQRLSERPYLQPLVSEVGSRLSYEYGKVSQRMYRTLVWQEPLTFLKQVARTHYIYLMDGCRFLALFMKDRPWMPYAGVLLFASGLCVLTFMQAYVATYLLGARLLVRWWRHGAGSLGEVDRGVIVLVLGVLVLSGVFSLVCCENGRWFLQSTPYLIPLVAYFVQHVVWPAPAAASIGETGRPSRRTRA